MTDKLKELFDKYKLNISNIHVYKYIMISFVNNRIEVIDLDNDKLKNIIIDYIKWIFRDFSEISESRFLLFKNQLSKDEYDIFNFFMNNVSDEYRLLSYMFRGSVGSFFDKIDSLIGILNKYYEYDNIIDYVEYLVNLNSEYFNNDSIISIINRNDELKLKYNHLIQAKKFDLI